MMRTLAAAVLALTAMPGTVQAQQKVDEKRAASPDGVVEIENGAGSIKVIGWNRSEVTVTGTLGAGAEGLTISGGAKKTSIEVETEGNPHGISSDLEIHVPAGSRVEIESFAASVSVTDVTGTVSAEGVNNNIVITGAAKEVSAQTVNGTVEITGAATRVHAESVNGAVTIKGGGGSVEANTVNGRLSVAGGTFEHGSLETVAGGLRFEGDLARGAEIEATTVSGGVELVVPAGVSADFSITTFSGDVQTDFGASAQRKRGHATQKEVEFSTGGGDAKVTVQTLSGSIAVRKRP
jgi:DUF4097 and DUF4098 domain-containing protein YvlB